MMYIKCMKRTQIQFPDPLYAQAKKLAHTQDWTLAEVVRRALELYIAQYSSKLNPSKDWQMPKPLALGGDFIFDPSETRAEATAILNRNGELFS